VVNGYPTSKFLHQIPILIREKIKASQNVVFAKFFASGNSKTIFSLCLLDFLIERKNKRKRREINIGRERSV
jgi:hypothetical protein